jgi:hypothetical protein
VDELTREMGCTLAEFERWLPGATRNARIDSTANAHRVYVEGGMVDITLLERSPRRIASLALPVLSVSLRFSGMSQAACAAFLAYFDNYTRRGGG